MAKLSWRERSANSLKGYRPSNRNMRICVDALRKQLFPPLGRIPLDAEFTQLGVSVPRFYNPDVVCTVIVEKSKSTGRGMRGMRLYVQCPVCGEKLSAGRLHQHCGYFHPDAR